MKRRRAREGILTMVGRRGSHIPSLKTAGLGIQNKLDCPNSKKKKEQEDCLTLTVGPSKPAHIGRCTLSRGAWDQTSNQSPSDRSAPKMCDKECC
jgi:hypothetical protein